jgi:hypothetical protein
MGSADALSGGLEINRVAARSLSHRTTSAQKFCWNFLQIARIFLDEDPTSLVGKKTGGRHGGGVGNQFCSLGHERLRSNEDSSTSGTYVLEEELCRKLDGGPAERDQPADHGDGASGQKAGRKNSLLPCAFATGWFGHRCGFSMAVHRAVPNRAPGFLLRRGGRGCGSTFPGSIPVTVHKTL